MPIRPAPESEPNPQTGRLSAPGSADIDPPRRTRTTTTASPSPEAERAIPSPSSESVAEVGYEVGRGKPPRHSRFKPGQSGNPRGRPRQAKGLKTIIREIMTEKVAVRLAGGERKVSRMQAVVLKTVESALRGNPRAMTELLRLYSTAIPDSDPAQDLAPTPDMTETDFAILEQFRHSIINGEETPA